MPEPGQERVDTLEQAAVWCRSYRGACSEAARAELQDKVWFEEQEKEQDYSYHDPELEEQEQDTTVLPEMVWIGSSEAEAKMQKLYLRLK